MRRPLMLRRLTTLRVPRKSPRKRLSVQIDDNVGFDPREMPTGLLMGPC